MKRLIPYIRLARPHQYLKNGFIWLPIFFGLKLNVLEAFLQTLWTFVAFCLTASVVYILNDMMDIHEDRRHPVKKWRPLANKTVTRVQASVFIGVLAALSGVVSVTFLAKDVLLVVVAYFLLNLAYSLKLKYIPIVDVVCIALGFDLRVTAGGMAGNVWISHWLILMVFLLALFLAIAKRRGDLLLLNKDHFQKQLLKGYNLAFLNSSLIIMATVTVISYILYCVSPEVVEKHGTSNLYLTTFWVVVGLLRYLQIMFVQQRNGSPTRVILRDAFMQAVVILWLVHFFVLLYVKGG